MEMKKLHMGTMSFGSDTMDEVAHQLDTAFSGDGEPGPIPDTPSLPHSFCFG